MLNVKIQGVQPNSQNYAPHRLKATNPFLHVTGEKINASYSIGLIIQANIWGQSHPSSLLQTNSALISTHTYYFDPLLSN